MDPVVSVVVGGNLLKSKVIPNPAIEVGTIGVGIEKFAVALGRDVEVPVDLAIAKAEFQPALCGGVGNGGERTGVNSNRGHNRHDLPV
jgi:hypothetical protein